MDNDGLPLSQSAPRQMHEAVYNVLDVVEERLIADNRGSAGSGMSEGKPLLQDGGFIGCLGVFGLTALYGCLTNGGYKMFIAIRGNSKDVDADDSSMRTAFRKLGDSLIAALLNPMYETETPLRSKKFSRAVAQVVRWYN